MQKSFLFILMAMFCWAFSANAKSVTGTVTDESNEPLPGVSVLVMGTTHGTMTDYDGKFSISDVADNATVRFSCIGYTTQEVKVGGRSTIDVTMKEDIAKLDEVVVIGYGSAQAKDLTSPITVVKGSEIANIPTTSPMSALQGKVAGVNIMNNGTPGASPTVRIRGTGSFGAASPLYVVDGTFYDDISFLNNDDIEDMSILKDASAAAIYGVKAANGVVIITTKKGARNMPAKVTYNGYVGFQSVTKRLKMANSHQYATMMTEANATAYNDVLQSSINLYGGDFSTLTFGADTDWYSQLLRSAVITNHSLNVSGGGERATYSLGMSYLYQDGIMKSDNNNYSRLNFRGQVDYQATKWLKVGFNGVFSQATQRTPDNSAWQVAYNAPGIFPVYDESRGDEVFPVKYASPTQIGIDNNIYNPVATANASNSKNSTNRYMTNFYAQFNILPNKLDFKTSYGKDYTSIAGITVGTPYFVATNQRLVESTLSKSETKYDNFTWDNVLTYKDQYGDHGFGAMVGYSMRQDKYSYLNGTVTGIPTDKEEYWYLNNGNAETLKSTDGGYRYRSQSIFTRLNYDYLSKYLLMFTFRADGTSKYQEKWGYFPSVGAAWVMSSEEFMKNQNVFDYFKLRASWGMLGNDGVAASDGFASITTGNGASGVFGSNTYPGYQNNIYYSWLKWEVVKETNVGVNFTTLKDRLSVDIDYYHRLTDNAVISPLLPFENTSLAGNYGKILNSGVDLSLNWNDRVGNFKYWIGANASFLHNRVRDLQGKNVIIGSTTANIVGEKMNQFYGYKVIGVYQTAEEVAADPIGVANGCEPGDLIYEDVNGDGVLDGQDRQGLGSYIPDVTYSFNFGFSIKNFDFSLTTYGQAGAKLFNRKRALRYASAYYNFDEAQYLDRWTGPGSTNTNPSSAALFKSYTTQSGSANSYYVESADYFRIQNITVGYTVKNLKMGAYRLPSMRFSLTADRPFTFFKAHTFTPELSDASGWDTQVYPLASTFTFGLQIEF
jgi:TonB-linked SusC/RagA family outer membrane protein